MPRYDHLPKQSQERARSRRWTDARIDQLVAEFFRRGKMPKIIESVFDEYIDQIATDEERAETTIVKSVMLEQCRASTYRMIVFETDWTGSSSVLNIHEFDNMIVGKRVYDSEYADLEHVHLGIGAGILKVVNPFAAALALMQKTYTED